MSCFYVAGEKRRRWGFLGKKEAGVRGVGERRLLHVTG